MATLGVTFGQIGIASTKYGDLREFHLPPLQRNYLQHVTSASTTFPTKNLGYVPSTLSGVMQITAASVDEFVTAVTAGTETKVSFLLGATEYCVYGYGTIDSIECINVYGSATRTYLVGFSFTLSRSKVYVAATGATFWGG